MMALTTPLLSSIAFVHSENRASSLNPKEYYFHCCTKKHSSFSWTSFGKLRHGGKKGSVPLYRKNRQLPMLCVAEENGVSTAEDAPWEGAVIYRRSASQTHFEYCTTLERLSLSKLSSEISKSTASTMGIRVTRGVTDYPAGTPVQISIDVSRRKRDLKLDGIIRTFITLMCNRCGEPAAERVFPNFCLLLTEKPLKMPAQTTLRVVSWADKAKRDGEIGEDEEEDTEIDLDDQIHFPPEEKEIDISKYIRDTVHLEFTINAVCDINCKGMCFNCGTNLNRNTCNCGTQNEDVVYGPLRTLKKQMQKQ